MFKKKTPATDRNADPPTLPSEVEKLAQQAHHHAQVLVVNAIPTLVQSAELATKRGYDQWYRAMEVKLAKTKAEIVLRQTHNEARVADLLAGKVPGPGAATPPNTPPNPQTSTTTWSQFLKGFQ